MNTPNNIVLKKSSNQLLLEYGEQSVLLSAEFLRVHSPSAEVQGHSPDQRVLQHGKQNVSITNIEKQGHYALRLYFDDGHNTGIYSWNYLKYLSDNQESLWQSYLQELRQAGKSRDPNEQVVQLITPTK